MPHASQMRDLGKYLLFIGNTPTVLGFSVIFLLISTRFINQTGQATVIIGIILGLRQFIQQGLGIFGGVIADRFGAKPVTITSMLMRTAGFATMSIAHKPWLLWFSCLLSGLGDMLSDSPHLVLVVKLIRPQQRGRFFSLLMIQNSAGAVINALLGSWLLQHDSHPVRAIKAVLSIPCTAFDAWLLPAQKLSIVRTPVREGMTCAMCDKRFVTCVPILAGYYMLTIQAMLMLPIMVDGVVGMPSAVRWMYIIKACLSLALLYPTARWSERHFRPEHWLMAGLLIMPLSMMPVDVVSGLQQLFTLICLFYIGSIIAEPMRETLSISLADVRARGDYMEFNRSGLAIGGATGYVSSGWLLSLSKSVRRPEFPWMMLGIIGIFTFPTLGWQFSQERATRRLLECDV